MPCVWSINVAGEEAIGKFAGQCAWCNMEELQRRCEGSRLKKLQLVNFKQLVALNGRRNVSLLLGRVPEAHRQDFEAAADDVENAEKVKAWRGKRRRDEDDDDALFNELFDIGADSPSDGSSSS